MGFRRAGPVRRRWCGGPRTRAGGRPPAPDARRPSRYRTRFDATDIGCSRRRDIPRQAGRLGDCNGSPALAPPVTNRHCQDKPRCAQTHTGRRRRGKGRVAGATSRRRRSTASAPRRKHWCQHQPPDHRPGVHPAIRLPWPALRRQTESDTQSVDDPLNGPATSPRRVR